MRKTKILIFFLIILNLIFIYFLGSEKSLFKKEYIVEIEGPISMQVNEPPSFYKATTNFLSFEIKNINQKNLIVKIDSSVIEYYPDYGFFEVNVFKTGRSNLELFYKEDNGDTIKIYDRIIFIKDLPQPIPYFGLSDTVSKEYLLEKGRIYCINSLNRRSEQTFEIEYQTMVATVDRLEREESSNNGNFSIKQRELIKQLNPGQHLIIKNIRVVLPDSTKRILKPFVIIIKDD